MTTNTVIARVQPWENNWTEQAGCKLVSYQTPFYGLKPGDYVGCVRKAFPHVEIVDDTRD